MTHGVVLSVFGKEATLFFFFFFFFFVFILPAVRSTSSELKEYCQSEYFNVTCDRYEVIVMETAKYGRMHAGRCVTNNLGCSIDVMGYFDAQCSGRRQCSIYIADANLHKMAPCPKDFSSYLEAKYTCIAVARPSDSLSVCRRDKHVTFLGSTIGYLASVTSVEHGFGLADCPWRILAGIGQTIRLTLMTFGGRRSSEESNLGHSIAEPCYDFGEAREAHEKRPLSMCTGSGRERVIFTSAGNDVIIQLLPKDVLRGMPVFVIKYEVQGCQSMKAPPGGWLRIDGNTATVRCNGSKETWYLTCTDNQWLGYPGNCTDKSTTARSAGVAPLTDDGFPYGILVVVAIGVALGVLIGGILLSFVAYYMKRQSHLRRYSEPAELTKQMMDETDPYGTAAGGHPSSPAPKGPPPDARYVHDLPYSRTMISYTEEDGQIQQTQLQRCTCPKGHGPHCTPSCHANMSGPDIFTATRKPVHTYESPEFT